MIRTLTRFEESWAFAALGAIYPSGASARLSIGVCDLALGDYLRDLFATIPLMAALGLRAAIWIVALAPPIVLGRMVTVLGLDPAQRQALVERLVGSTSYGVRQLVLALKAIGGLYFGGAAGVKAAIFGSGPLAAPSATDLVPPGRLALGRERGAARADVRL